MATTLERIYQKKLSYQIKHLVMHWLVVTWATILVINLTVLGVIYFSIKQGWWKQDEVIDSVLTPEAFQAVPIVDCDKTCSPVCQDIFAAAIATLSGQKGVKANFSAPLPDATKVTNNVREYYIPLGSRTMKSFGTWGDTGMQAYIDPANYPGIRKVYFEASVHIPTANGSVSLRLVQANEGLFLPGSEISVQGATPQIVSSQPLTLFTGNKLYKVQIKNGMDYEAVVDFARLKLQI